MEKALGRRVTFAIAFLGGKSDQAGPLTDSWCPCRYRLSTRITWVTIHASALLAVAEEGSAEFLLQHFNEVVGYVPVVRRLEAKFRRSARGRVSARASVEGDALNRLSSDLRTKGRALIRVSVEVVDEGEMVVLSGVVEWFIARAVATA